MGVLFFCSQIVLAQNAQDPQWQKLLLYRPTVFGIESEADDASFFAHPEGKRSPEQELEGFIDSLSVIEPDQKKNSHCRFPARVRWLKKFRQVPEPTTYCENYLRFRNRLAAKSISVVFSSYYLNNPGSSFGHTFLRLGKQSNEERDVDNTATELLDTGINYGAMTEGAGPLLFAIGGLAGWFSGNYNAVPYYYKVREYNDYETRDLWSYQLAMTQEEIDMIVDHIWELGNSRFDYFFLTENCSYHVLSILETARPTLRLHEFMPRLYTIPSETLKALEADNLVRKITFRPSASTQFYHQLKLLNHEESEAVKELVYKDKNTLPSIEAKRAALVYDTAISLVDYQYAKEILKSDEKAQALKRPLLVSRSKIPVRSEDLNFNDRLWRAPHLGHGQKRIGLTYINSGAKNVVDAEWRFAFHDILDSDVGFPPKTKLEVMKAIVRSDGRDYQLREFNVVDVMTLGKWDSFNHAPSWKGKLGHWQTRVGKKQLSTQGFQAGYGYSYELGVFSPFFLAHLENAYVSESAHRYKLAYGADLGILMEFRHDLKLLSAFEARAYPWNESRFTNEMRFSNRNFGVGTYYGRYLTDGVEEMGLRFFKYL